MSADSDDKVRKIYDKAWIDGATNPGKFPGSGAALPFFTKDEFVKGFVPPAFLIDDIVQRNYFYALTAKTGHGKTAIALLFAYHVAHGIPIDGRKVEPGNVLYLAGENADDLRARMILCDAEYGFKKTKNQIIIIPEIFDLAKKQSEIAIEANKVGGFSLVIVDTGAAYFIGDDDNSNREMLVFAHTLRELTEIPGNPAVLALMHPTKYADKEKLLPRGGGAFLNETDGNLTLWMDSKEKAVLSWAGKLRGPGFEPIAFKIETKTNEKLIDHKKRRIPSVVAFPMTEKEERDAEQGTISDENALLENMSCYPSDSFKERCERLGWVTDKGEPSKSKMQNTLNRLKDHGLIKKGRKKWELTDKGTTEAEQIMGIK